MKHRDYEYAKTRVFRLPDEDIIRQRLQQKLVEYQSRRKRYIQHHQVAGFGVIIGNEDQTLLDAYYKEVLFSALLKKNIVHTQEVYHFLREKFHGRVNDMLFHNAVQVLGDYLNTGGSNTSGGSGFLDKKVFHKILHNEDQIRLPHDAELNRRLRKKYHEYLGRIADHEQHPEIHADRSILERDAYKAHIIDTLRHRGSVDIESMAVELEDRFGKQFRYQHFMQAAAVVRNYCQSGGSDVVGGTGL